TVRRDSQRTDVDPRQATKRPRIRVICEFRAAVGLRQVSSGNGEIAVHRIIDAECLALNLLRRGVCRWCKATVGSGGGQKLACAFTTGSELDSSAEVRLGRTHRGAGTGCARAQTHQPRLIQDVAMRPRGRGDDGTGVAASTLTTVTGSARNLPGSAFAA